MVIPWQMTARLYGVRSKPIFFTFFFFDAILTFACTPP